MSSNGFFFRSILLLSLALFQRALTSLLASIFRNNVFSNFFLASLFSSFILLMFSQYSFPFFLFNIYVLFYPSYTSINKFEPFSGGVYSKQHYVIKLVSDLRHVGGFLHYFLASLFSFLYSSYVFSTYLSFFSF